MRTNNFEKLYNKIDNKENDDKELGIFMFSLCIIVFLLMCIVAIPRVLFEFICSVLLSYIL